MRRQLELGQLNTTSESNRLEGFSDGVFAISITLLGLGLEVPDPSDGSLLRALAMQWPGFLAFVTSFVSIGIIWINHHRLFTHIRWVSHGLLLLNGLLLMAVALIPFTTNLVARYIIQDHARVAAAVYALGLVFVTGSFNLLWRHATRRLHLLDNLVTAPTVQRINKQYGFGPLLFSASLLVAVFSAFASVLLDIAFAVFFALPAFTFADAQRAAVHQETRDRRGARLANALRMKRNPMPRATEEELSRFESEGGSTGPVVWPGESAQTLRDLRNAPHGLRDSILAASFSRDGAR